MVAVIRLHDATEPEFGCLGIALTRWVGAGGFLGGQSSKGHWACRVRVAGAIRHSPPTGTAPMSPGTAVGLPQGGDGLARSYDAHVRERAEAIRACVATKTRG